MQNKVLYFLYSKIILKIKIKFTKKYQKEIRTLSTFTNPSNTNDHGQVTNDTMRGY